jgi:hypothetical protein
VAGAEWRLRRLRQCRCRGVGGFGAVGGGGVVAVGEVCCREGHDILPIDIVLLASILDHLFLSSSVLGASSRTSSTGAADESLEETGLLTCVAVIVGGVRGPRAVGNRFGDHAVVASAYDEGADDDGGRDAEEEDQGR